MVGIRGEPFWGQSFTKVGGLYSIMGLLALTATIVSIVGCEGTSDDENSDSSVQTRTVHPLSSFSRAEGPGRRATCIKELEEMPVVAPDKELDDYYASIPQIVLTARITPVVYLATPKRAPDPRAKAAFEELQGAKSPRKGIRTLTRRYRTNKALLRRVFLRQGYLFASNARVAEAMVREIQLEDLFDEERIYLQRGGTTHILVRGEDGYFGSDENPAKLLLNDRVSEDRFDFAVPLHIDLGRVREQTGATRTILVATGESSAWLELRFPDGRRLPAKVDLVDRQTNVACIADDRETVESLRARSSRFWWNHEKIIEAAELMVAERVLFDEPKDEEEGVQEDGDLRLEWNKAYHRGEKTFFLREEEYRVFDFRGNPTPPQVCIDFILDVFERANGTWYRKRGRRPGRSFGGINFYSIKGMNRRNLPSVLEFAEDPKVPMTRYDIPKTNWIPLRKRQLFANNLAKYTSVIREGDILVIHGLREQDMAEHYHAVLVLETEPMTGMPMVVADNQGRPRIGSLFQAMVAAPLRSIKHVIRVDLPEMEIYSRREALKNTERAD